ncbi:diacylglycerol kinase family lipid kinase [Mucilaginibacter sp. HMF5004]|uniref:diacylglycerol/lipid kinase family protein n=1 Tax=Mucilaginibacter rivuli TaxID=2857527 RepID=UPI001C5FE5CD|nr:diacylglycerol kinase family protein [Mucilaginibacter rivuli]MBW4890500.1 diacylglycerol kinase family lipid kinase [Mucilaginibacter rivuli]
MKKRALFIINPVSGGKNKDSVPGLIGKHFDKNSFDYTIVHSTLEKPIRTIAKEAMAGYDIIVAVGGDGTVNEIASAIAGTDKVLAVIPYGSGNGLSRFLQIPMDPVKAIAAINEGHTQIMDAGKVNGQWFFNMAGIGFDAHISEVFARTKHRGFRSYFESSVKEISKYKAKDYHIEIDGDVYERNAFMLCFANSSQFGNNAHVSPDASLHDGLIDVVIVKQFPVIRLLEMGLRMLFKKVESSKYVQIIRGRDIKVSRKGDGPLHLDGEPQITGPILEIKVVPNALNVIVGANYKP